MKMVVYALPIVFLVIFIGGDFSRNVCDLTHITGLHSGVSKSVFPNGVWELGSHSINSAADR